MSVNPAVALAVQSNLNAKGINDVARQNALMA